MTTLQAMHEPMSAGAHLREALRLSRPRLGRPNGLALAPVLAIGLSLAIWFLPETLSVSGRLALVVTTLAVIAWTLTPLPDSLVALVGALALVGLGVLPRERLYAALGDEIVWLMIGAFLIAAVLQSSGLVERVLARVLAPVRTLRGLLFALTVAIALTAFLVPSTSGRAALLLPVFLALADRLPDERLVRPLALLFPSVILLSAGGALTGAGAHLIAAETIAARTGHGPSFLGWIALAFPVAMLSSLASAWLILRIFVPADLRAAPLPSLADRQAGGPLDRRQAVVAIVSLAMVLAWATAPLHGVDVALVAIVGATILMSRLATRKSPKEIFRGVEMELILFLAATTVMAEAITATGADRWMAAGLMAALPPALTQSTAAVVLFACLVALAAHLAINSRSARAAVLIPMLALPLAGLGHDATVLVMVTVLGTGFCQTMMASAKPVAVFGNLDRPTFGNGDLARLALPLLPVKLALLAGFALLVWPHQLDRAPALLPAPAAAVAEAPASRPLLVPAVATASAAAPAAPRTFPGALCTRDELRLVMLEAIARRALWADGWWHVWKRLTRDGIAVERSAVKAIYREDDLVRLRPSSPALRQDLSNKTAVRDAVLSCARSASK